MTERPILMSAVMVRSLLAGLKTRTRRVMRPQPVLSHGGAELIWERPGGPVRLHPHSVAAGVFSPYGDQGDRLWVRETWRAWMGMGEATVEYAADGALRRVPNRSATGAGWHITTNDLADYAHDEWCDRHKRSYDCWRPSIHMPRAACRLILPVSSVTVAVVIWSTEPMLTLKLITWAWK